MSKQNDNPNIKHFEHYPGILMYKILQKEINPNDTELVLKKYANKIFSMIECLETEKN